MNKCVFIGLSASFGNGAYKLKPVVQYVSPPITSSILINQNQLLCISY